MIRPALRSYCNFIFYGKIAIHVVQLLYRVHQMLKHCKMYCSLTMWCHAEVEYWIFNVVNCCHIVVYINILPSGDTVFSVFWCQHRFGAVWPSTFLTKTVWNKIYFWHASATPIIFYIQPHTKDDYMHFNAYHYFQTSCLSPIYLSCWQIFFSGNFCC